MQASPTAYPSGAYCLRETVRTEGIRGLYRGACPALVGHTVKAAVVFMSYGTCQELVMKMAGATNRQDLNVAHHACAGALTAVTASFVLCPIEVVKCRMQVAHSVKDQKGKLRK